MTPGRCRVCPAEEPRPYCRMGDAQYWRCGSCGLIFLDPLPDRLRMRDHAEELYAAGVYGEYVGARELKLEHFRRRLARFADRVPRGRLLDIGCSCGYFIEVARAAGYDASGVEFSRAAIAAAAPGIRERISNGNVNDLSALAAGSYDLVTAFDIIEHTEDPVDFLRQARRLLRKGGAIVISTPDTGHWLRPLLGCSWPMLQPLQHTVLFSRRAMATCLERAGFSVAATETAYKVLSLDYLFDQLRDYFPRTHGWYEQLRRRGPARLLRRPRALNIGELLAIGVAAGDDAAP